MGIVLFIHLLFDKHLDCFFCFTIVNNTPLNICTEVFVWIYAFIFLG